MLACGATPAHRGHSRVMMKGGVSLISWYNKGHFRFLTNAYSPTKQGGCCPDATAGAPAAAHLCLPVTGVIIKRKSGEIPCPLAVEAFAAHLSYICKYDDKFSRWVGAPPGGAREPRPSSSCCCSSSCRYFIFHKPNKTWQQVFWSSISIASNNAYIL